MEHFYFWLCGFCSAIGFGGLALHNRWLARKAWAWLGHELRKGD